MPPLSRWFVKAGFISLALALVFELLLARPRGLWPALPDAALHLGAVHLLTVGWLLQLITGVAYWMFPRHPTAPPRGDARPGWLALGLLNVGLLIRLFAESWRLGFGGPRWPLAVSAVLQFAAVLLLVQLLWPRVREMRS
ncbi:MAG TPA: hypothetical protein VFS33_01415 [Gemmatimonadales bacterium]|nr:hypothetical protein [Gemmatimonadales bacterium]